MGDGAEPGVEQGPLVDRAAFDKVSDLVAEAVACGAEVATGGGGHALGGTWFEPTVLTGITPAMKIAREEIFGPVSAVVRFEDEAEVIAAANDTDFGLAAYAYTRDLARAFRLTETLAYGLIGINEGLITTVEAPFGGLKESGLGKEGGSQGLSDYLDSKYTCIGGL